jgi:putative PIN family toxin of toxin-antitoxin system
VKRLLKVVFDTNILFSAVGWTGVPFQCLEAARHKEFSLILSEYILAELSEKLTIKRTLSEVEVREIVTKLRAFSEVITTAGLIKVVESDPDDDAILECAVEAAADCLVTGDSDLLNLKSFKQIRILRAAEFLAEVREPE